MGEVGSAHAYCSQLVWGCLNETSSGRGREGAEFAGLRARSSSGRVECACVRCVFACGHSSRHQLLSLSCGELAVRLLRAACPFLPSPPLFPLRADSMLPASPSGAEDSQAQVRRAQRASHRSRLPQPPPSPAVRPLGVHSSGVLPAATQPAPNPSTLPWPHRCSPSVLPQVYLLLCLGLYCHSLPPQPEPVPFRWGCRRPPLASSRGLLFIKKTHVAAPPSGLKHCTLTLLTVPHLSTPSHLSLTDMNCILSCIGCSPSL